MFCDPRKKALTAVLDIPVGAVKIPAVPGIGHVGIVSAEGEQLVLLGVNDPSFETDYLLGDSETVMRTKLAELHTAA